MGQAIDLVCDALEINNMPERGLPPVLVLISDGQPTDNFDAPLERLVRMPWGAKSVRVGIAIGDDADTDVLQRFMGGDARELKPLVATNAQDLVKFIKWASTVPLALLRDRRAGQRMTIPNPTFQFRRHLSICRSN